MQVKIEPSWANVLADEFEQPYFEQLIAFVKQQYATATVYPPGPLIFNAFQHCPFERVRVVILGQDPYHGRGQANGLSFSVADGIAKPPSLQNIFKELAADTGAPIPQSGNLERWADQGVLLLNATLTVRASEAGSHQNQGWERFTDAVIRKISEGREHVVFILWGAYAQKKGAVIDTKKHLVIKSAHPSPFAADKGFFGSRPFSQANEWLRAHHEPEISW
jgi:uracil-DNA glycosylase